MRASVAKGMSCTWHDTTKKKNFNTAAAAAVVEGYIQLKQARARDDDKCRKLLPGMFYRRSYITSVRIPRMVVISVQI